jgi:adenylate kinase family enzyme
VNPCRVLVLGATASGVTTLGRALAARWSVPHADTDDYFWEPTEPPYTVKRAEDRRIQLMQDMFLPRRAWVLTGSVMGWGEPLLDHVDVLVFCSLDPDVRLERLRAREAVRYGDRIRPGGDLATTHEDFVTWAAGYEIPDFPGRSRTLHEAWMTRFSGPVVRVDTARPVDELVAELAGP